MTEQPVGPRCGNNPNFQMSSGDRKAVDDFKARLALQAFAKPYIDSAAWADGDPLMEVIAATLWKHCARDDRDMPQLVCDDPRTIAAFAAAVARAHAALPTTADQAAPELTAEEARDLADELGTDLYRAQDALAFVGECCDIADREDRQIATADVREWLKGARCGRQLFAEQADRAALRDRIAKTLARTELKPPFPHCLAMADAVLGVLPAGSGDTAAVRGAALLEGADELGRMDYDTDSNDYGYDTYRDAWNGGVMDGADLLRRLAAEPQPAAPVHIGGQANAEDCPACCATPTPPPYPWTCPGPDAAASAVGQTDEETNRG